MTPAEPQNPGKEEEPAAPFEQVFARELADIKRRRGQSDARDSTDPKSQRDLRREALNLDLVGLALSGGGIRSATFCLGVLQGLAELALLGRLDYMSTVSGGGYIGGWLAAWVKREGDLANVEKQLKPNRIEQSAANRPRPFAVGQRTDEEGADGRVLDEEPEPIRHLRAYSNYLAPRPSLFSADGWVLIAIYLRNLLLNQFVFVLMSAALVLGVAAVVQLAAITAYGPDLPAWNAADESNLQETHDAETSAAAAVNALGAPHAAAFLSVGAHLPPEWHGGSSTRTCDGRDPFWYWVFYGIIAALMIVACGGVYRSVAQIAEAEAPSGAGRNDHGPSMRTEKRKFKLYIVCPLAAAAFCASLFSLYHFGPVPTDGWAVLTDPKRLWDLAAVAAFVGLLNGLLYVPSLDLFRLLAGRPNPAAAGRGTTGDPAGRFAAYLFRIVVAGLIGALGGALFYVAVFELHTALGSDESPLADFWVPSVVTLCPPLMLAVFVLVGFIQTGLQGETLTEAQREWRSSLGGYLLAVAVAWLALFGVALYGPWLWFSAGDWGPPLLAAAWSALVGGGVAAAWSPLTGSDKASPTPGGAWLGLLAKVAPPVFLAGVVLLIVVLSTSTIWDFQIRNAGDYLQRIDSANVFAFDWGLYEPSPVTFWTKFGVFIGAGALTAAFALFLSWRFNINIFSMNGLYANRLVRCYLGASRLKHPKTSSEGRLGAAMNVCGPPRNPNAVTGFDPQDDLKLSDLRTADTYQRPEPTDRQRGYWGPVPLVCTALNLVHGEELAWQERKAESFVLTPRFCGGSTTGYRPTEHYAGGLSLGQAMSISGAAVSPNWGFYSTPSVTALLTLFNARLGAWLGNPKKDSWKYSGPKWGLFYLLHEMLGRTNDHSDYVYLSDGGHFEDLGVYELIRRRCRFIIACDGGADPKFSLQDLGNMIRKVRIDFGVRIEIDVEALRPRADDRRSGSHVAVGKIRYGDMDGAAPPDPEADADPAFQPDRDEGLLVYIKAGLTGDEPPDLLNYVADHPDFPNQSTLNQFFTESEFESYRALGYHSAITALGDAAGCRSGGAAESNRQFFKALYDLWYPPPPDFTQAYLKSNEEYLAVQDALRSDGTMRYLSAELEPEVPGNVELLRDEAGRRQAEVRNAERRMVLRMLTVLEDAWFGLHLDRYRQHPFHSGWMEVYKRWLGLPTIRANWQDLKKEFSQVFQNAAERLVPLLRQTEAGEP